jgi:hypothetical protein
MSISSLSIDRDDTPYLRQLSKRSITPRSTSEINKEKGSCDTQKANIVGINRGHNEERSGVG